MIRLLPKSDIAKRRAEEARQRAEEGMRIAGMVDTLRETLANEERAFEDYRSSSLKAIQEEIDNKKSELCQLESDIKRKQVELQELDL